MSHVSPDGARLISLTAAITNARRYNWPQDQIDALIAERDELRVIMGITRLVRQAGPLSPQAKAEILTIIATPYPGEVKVA